MSYGKIYKFQNMLNNKVYIGQTKQDGLSRVKQHLLNNHHSKLYEGIVNDGLRNFTYEFIDFAETPEELNARELYWINYYDSIKTGYNTQHSNSHRIDVKLENNKLSFSMIDTNRQLHKKVVKSYLETDKIKNIFDYIYKNYPQYLLMFILSYNGLKLNEFIKVKVKDVMDNNEVKKIINVNDKNIHLFYETQVFLKNYILNNKMDLNSFIFKSQKTGKPFNKNSVTNLFHKIYTDLGIENCSTHFGVINYNIYRDNNKLNDYVNAIFSFNKRTEQ